MKLSLFTNTTFTFDSQQSTQYGLILVNLDTGEKHASFSIGREISEEKVKNNPIPYFFGVEEEPLYFTVTLAREDGEEWDYDTRVNVVKWLFQDEYKPFISTDHPYIVFNCMIVERPEKILIGNTFRLIELTFRCDSPWAWSPFFINNYDLSDNESTQIITMNNSSNIEKYNHPEIWIKSLDGGTISLKNTSDGGREFILNDLQVNETIYLNNKLKQIETDVPSVYRLKDFNRSWLRLRYGVNQIVVTGKCLIKTRTRFGMAI